MTTVLNSMLALDGGTGFRNKIINGCGWASTGTWAANAEL